MTPYRSTALPALSLIEFASVPAGLVALDALAKEALVSVLQSGTVQGGHFLVLFAGEVLPVETSHRRALAVSAGSVVDEVILPHAEERILPAIAAGAVRWPAPGDSLGVLQIEHPPTLLRAVDAALKGAMVELVELRIADGLGGKAMATLWGETHDVEAALSLAGGAGARHPASAVVSAVIRNADAEVINAVRSGSRFFQEWRG